MLREPARVGGLDDVVSIDGRYDHICALRRDGGVWCWGAGAGPNQDASAPTPVDTPRQIDGLPAVARIAVGNRHALGVTATGMTWCWGRSDAGQCGAAATGRSTVPVRVPELDDCSVLRGGYYITCGVRRDGRVLCGGANLGSEIPQATPNRRIPFTPIEGVIAATDVQTGGHVNCATRREPGVMCWGDRWRWLQSGGVGPTDEPGTPPSIWIGSGEVAEIAIGGFTCLRRSDGAVACGGDNRQGTLPGLPERVLSEGLDHGGSAPWTSDWQLSAGSDPVDSDHAPAWQRLQERRRRLLPIPRRRSSLSG